MKEIQGENRGAPVREWLTPRQAMKVLDMSKGTFWRRVHGGEIEARRDGPKTYRINRQALQSYLKRTTFDPGA